MLVAERQYLTVEEVANHLHVDPETIRRWLKQKQLIGYRFGKQWRVRPADLEQFIRESRNLGEQPNADPDTEKSLIITFPYLEHELGR